MAQQTTDEAQTTYHWLKAVRKSTISRSAKALALVLWDYMNESGEDCYPGQATLAEELNGSRRSVRNWTDELRGAGLIRVEEVYAANGRTLGLRYYAHISGQPLGRKPASPTPFRGGSGLPGPGKPTSATPSSDAEIEGRGKPTSGGRGKPTSGGGGNPLPPNHHKETIPKETKTTTTQAREHEPAAEASAADSSSSSDGPGETQVDNGRTRPMGAPDEHRRPALPNDQRLGLHDLDELLTEALGKLTHGQVERKLWVAAHWTDAEIREACEATANATRPCWAYLRTVLERIASGEGGGRGGRQRPKISHASSLIAAHGRKK